MNKVSTPPQKEVNVDGKKHLNNETPYANVCSLNHTYMIRQKTNLYRDTFNVLAKRTIIFFYTG